MAGHAARRKATFALVAAILVALAGMAPMPASQASTHPDRFAAGPAYPAWLRIDPRQPRTLYLGGTTGCDHGCSAWIKRSDHGGATWQPLLDFARTHASASACNSDSIAPLLVAPDGRPRVRAMRSC